MKVRHLLRSPEGDVGGGSGGNSSQADGGQQSKDQKTQGDGGGTAGASGDGKKESGDSGELDVSKLDPKAQKLIKDLRKENAEARKRNGSLSESHDKLKKALVEAGIIEDDEGTPEEKLKVVASQHEQVVFNNALLEAALEHNVSKDDLSYFRFLVSEKIQSLEDGAELGEEELAELAKQSRRSQPAQGASGTTSAGAGGTAPAPGGQSSVTLEQFVKMNMGEKTDLYLKHKDTYEKLMSEARNKRLIV